MGLYDRDYTQENFRQRFGGPPQMRLGLPKLTPAVKRLLIINVAVYFVQIFGADKLLIRFFSVHPISLTATLQIWRLVTYQFLHGHIWHILFNMIVLYILGSTLERHWGSRKFLIFYLCCGMVGGLVYPLLLGLEVISPHPIHGVLPMIGASGAILGVLAACAILFPHITLLFFFFPLPIRVVAIILTLIAIARIATGDNAAGEAAHLAGMAAGAIYVFSQSYRVQWKSKFSSSLSQKKVTNERDLQLQLDRILEKVHDSGIHSLTTREKRTLKRATKAQQIRTKL